VGVSQDDHPFADEWGGFFDHVAEPL